MTIDVKFQELNGEFNADFENTEQSFDAEFGQITQVVTGDHRKLQHREDANQHPMSAITGLEKALTDKLNKTDLPTAIDTALAQAKASGEFDGEDGKDYILNEEDIAEIVAIADEKIGRHNRAINSHNDIRLLIRSLTNRLNTISEWMGDGLDIALKFSSSSAFALVVNSRGWDGKMEYYNGTNWVEWNGTAIASIFHKNSYSIYIRGTGNTIVTGGEGHSWYLRGNSPIRCIGNIETLLDYSTVMAGEHPTMGEYCYMMLFKGCYNLVSAPDLPATILSTGCYMHMFSGCAALEIVPALPSTTLAPNCYDGMFWECGSLITMPYLPADTLADYCYIYMFYYCLNIKVSETLTDEYTQPYYIPEANGAEWAVGEMFGGTGGTFNAREMETGRTYYVHKDITIV